MYTKPSYSALASIPLINTSSEEIIVSVVMRGSTAFTTGIGTELTYFLVSSSLSAHEQEAPIWREA